jgi:hypothetical protein
MIERYAEALYASGILNQAAAVLERRLSDDAHDVEALNTLGEIFRKQGRLSDAAGIYDRMAALATEDGRASRLRAIFNGSVPSDAGEDALQPAPFVLLKDFLPRDLHRTILPLVLAAPEEKIIASTVGRDEYKPDQRVSFTVRGLKDVEKTFWTHVEAALPALLARLRVDPFAIGAKEVRIRTYRSGNFFEVHRDNSIPDTASRRVSFVYFFHREPRRYTGGDLLLFDTSADSRRYSITSFTRIVPVDNAIVLFPSRFYHAVVPVQCSSSDPGDNRFVINGHIRTEPPPASASA